MRVAVFLLLGVLLLDGYVVRAQDDEYDDDAAGSSHQVLSQLVMPKQEERLRAHFHIPPGTPLPTAPRRVSNVSQAEFREFMLRGQPVIVTDALRDWPGFGKWNCDYFHREFPNENVGGFTAYKADALKWRRKLGDPWFQQRENLNIPKEEEDPKNPQYMSWYFSAIGVDGTRGHEVERNETVVEMIKANMRFPYFLEDTKLNRDTFEGRLEFFFGTEGAGVHPHTDPVCQWIFSGQAAGKKSWRLSLPYNIDALEAANPGYKFNSADGNELLAMMMNKASIYEFTLSAGEMVFFPPGLIHTTRATGPECSTSFSVQLASPNPVEYIREFSPDLISDVIGASKCYVDHFNNWLFGASLPNKDGSPAANARFSKQMFSHLDADSSGAISMAEAHRHFVALAEELGSSAGGLVADDPQLDTDSFMAVHDSNHDGLVSRAEFDAILFSTWTPRMAQVAALTEKPQTVSFFFEADKNSDDYVTEEEWKAQYPDLPWADVLQYDDDKDGKLFQGELHEHVADFHRMFTGEELDQDIGSPPTDADKNEEQEEEPEDGDDGGEEGDEPEEDGGSEAADAPAPPAGGIKGLQMALDDPEALRSLWNIGASQGELPVPPVVVTELTEEQFREYGARGQPLVVADGLRGVDRSKWTCDSFKSRFPSEGLKQCVACEWTTLGETDVSAAPGTLWEYQALGAVTQIGAEQPERTPAIVEELIKDAAMPYFVPKSRVNTLLHRDHLNVFFGTKDGSLGPFTDMNCFWSVYHQAQGSSHWRITVPYTVRQLQEANSDYTYYPPDGAELVDRMLSENPVYQLTLEAGQSLVLPPGLLKHFTLEDDGCSVVYRTAFMDPAPVRYVRDVHEALMSDSDGAAGCYTDHYNRWLMGSNLPSSQGSEEENTGYVKDVFSQMDADKDGVITEAEASAHFPGEVDSGPIRTSELDGAAFVAANDADGSASVSEAELEETVQKLWTPPYADVGAVWYYVDQRNAEEGGNWADYGPAVDAIRFRFSREQTFEFDAQGNAKPSQDAPPNGSANIERFPPHSPRGQAVPDDFALTLDHPTADVTVARPRDGASGMGFVFWKKPTDKLFAGPFEGGQRLGVGVFCCDGPHLYDQEWAAGDDDGVKFPLKPASNKQVEPENRPDVEVVNDIPGMHWMGSLSITGPAAIKWLDTGDIYVGHWLNGRRVGGGIFEDGQTGQQEYLHWNEGDDHTDWFAVLEFPTEDEP